MTEPAEGTLRERRFAKSHGLVSNRTSIYANKTNWRRGFNAPVISRVTGIDVRRAGGNVLAARQRREATGAKPRRTVAAGGAKPTRTAKARFKQIGRKLARGR